MLLMNQLLSKTKQPKNEPWYTPGLRWSSKTKAKLLFKRLSIPSKYNKQKYKAFNILHKKLQRRLKATYFKNILEENKFNINKTWSTFNKITGKHNEKSGLSNNFVINNTQVGYRQEVAEAFNIFILV